MLADNAAAAASFVKFMPDGGAGQGDDDDEDAVDEDAVLVSCGGHID